MIRLEAHGIRARLAGIVLLSFLPMAAMVIYRAAEGRRVVRDEVRLEGLRSAEAVARSADELTARTQHLLTYLAGTPAVRGSDTTACEALLRTTLEGRTSYLSLYVVDGSGRLLCGFPLGPASGSAADRDYFQRAVATRGFVVGDYKIGRVTGQPCVHLALPVIGANGAVDRVVVASVDVTRLSQTIASVLPHPGHAVRVVDPNGTVVATHPLDVASLGRPLPGELQEVFAGRREVTGRISANGSQLLYAIVPLRSTRPAGAVVVTTPADAAFATSEARLRRDLMLVIGTALAFAALAHLLGERWIARPVQRMRDAASRLGSGDLGARVGTLGGCSELRRLGQAIDEMAESLGRITLQHHLLLESAGEGVIGLDPDGTITYVNAAAASMLGWNAQELRGRPMHATLHHSTRGGVAIPLDHCSIQGALRAGETRSVQEAFATRHGGWVDAACTITPVRTAGGVTGAVVVFSDVTERNRTEAALRASEEMHRHLFEHNPVPMWVFDVATMRFTRVNEAALEHYGYSREEFLSMTVRDLRPPEDMPALERWWRENRHGGRQHAGVWRHRKKDGSVVLADIVVHDLRRDGPAQRLVMARDVTAEHESEQRLRESEERFRQLAENIEEVFWLFDVREQRTVYVSPAFERVWGRPRPAFDADPILEAVHPDDRSRVSHAVAAGYEGFDHTYRIVRPDGSVRWIHDRAFPVNTADGTRWRVAGIATDVTHKRLAEEEIARQREALAHNERLASMTTLLAGVAHELNNPLAVVIGQADLLLRAAPEGPVAVRVEKIQQAASRCARIVADILSLARRRPGEWRPLALNEVVREAVDLLSARLAVDGVELIVDLQPGLPAVAADAHALVQVVTKLVTNAQQAVSGRPQKSIVVRTSIAGEGAEIHLEVEDTGPGIPEDMRRRVFDPFFTTREPGHGTGLGLAVCDGIVRNHGGRIDAVAGGAGGALLRVVLPMTRDAGEEPPAAEPALEVAPALTTPTTILVVDDEEEVAEVMSDLLTSQGHAVDIARDGSRALERLRQRTYDLVVTDVRMPGVDGPDLYRRAVELRPELAPRFLFMTGDALTPRTREFLETTGVRCLTKPFTGAEVDAIVEEALRRSRISAGA